MKKTVLLPLISCAFMALTGCKEQDAGTTENRIDSDFQLGIAIDGVPIGEYSKKVFNYFEVSKDTMLQKGVLTQYNDVKAVANAVKGGSVSAGIVYATDAFSNHLHQVDTATEAMCGKALYPICVVNNTAGHSEAAQFFVDYLTQANAKTVFEGVGFTMLEEAHTLGAAPTETVSVKVAAAASMTETINSLKASFEATYPNITIEPDYRGSKQLVASIIASPNDFDVFLSADTANMDKLVAENLIKENTRFNILENKVALVTPDDNPAKVTSFTGLFTAIKEYIK